MNCTRLELHRGWRRPLPEACLSDTLSRNCLGFRKPESPCGRALQSSDVAHGRRAEWAAVLPLNCEGLTWPT